MRIYVLLLLVAVLVAACGVRAPPESAAQEQPAVEEAPVEAVDSGLGELDTLEQELNFSDLETLDQELDFG